MNQYARALDSALGEMENAVRKLHAQITEARQQAQEDACLGHDKVSNVHVRFRAVLRWNSVVEDLTEAKRLE